MRFSSTDGSVKPWYPRQMVRAADELSLILRSNRIVSFENMYFSATCDASRSIVPRVIKKRPIEKECHYEIAFATSDWKFIDQGYAGAVSQLGSALVCIDPDCCNAFSHLSLVEIPQIEDLSNVASTVDCFSVEVLDEIPISNLRIFTRKLKTEFRLAGCGDVEDIMPSPPGWSLLIEGDSNGECREIVHEVLGPSGLQYSIRE